MKFKKIKLILVPIMLCTVLISGCSSGLNIGFSGLGEFIDDYECAVHSLSTVFNVNNVTLEFYYGGHVTKYSNEDERETLGVALYFCHKGNHCKAGANTPYEDYRNVEEHRFIKFVSAEELSSGEYDVDVSLFKGKTFKHHEPLTIPSEVFSRDEQSFSIEIYEILIYKDQPDIYYFSGSGSLTIHYKFLSDDTVLLS